MKTSLEVESLLVSPRPLSAAAANDEFGLPVKPVSGWDPFEVWRTRVKAAPDDSKSGAVIR
jgi:hypothetical protein